MKAADAQHMAWLARSFGKPDYLPLTPADLEALRDAAEIIKRYPGTHLFREGADATAAYLVREGTVDLYRSEGPSKEVVSRVGAGAVLGDIAMFAGTPYISSARAVDHVTAFEFDRERLLPHLARSPAICLRWLVAGLTQLERTQRRVINLMHRTVLGQVAVLLLDEADKSNEVVLSQATIGTLLGASRQSVNEALGVLRERGLVETGYRTVIVKDREGLREVILSE